MNTAEVLERAADLIDRDGWWQKDEFGSGNCAVLAMPDPGFLAGCKALASFLGLPTTEGPRTIYAWNDAPERTQAEVTSTMRACATVLRAKESTTQPVAEAVEA